MMATAERPSLDEQYMMATNSSDLTLSPDRVCAATHLIAAGLLGNRMGEALSHLRAEWDAIDKPRKMTEDEIAARAGCLPARKGKPDVKRARTESLVGYAVAMRKRAHELRGWRPALMILAEWAQTREVDMDLLSPALYHWLSPVCPVCDGVGFRWLYGSMTDSKPCFHCNGKRASDNPEGPTIWPRPLGAERIHQWLKGCIGRHKGERSGLINDRIDAGELSDRAARRQPPKPEDERGAAAVAEVARLSMVNTRRPKP